MRFPYLLAAVMITAAHGIQFIKKEIGTLHSYDTTKNIGYNIDLNKYKDVLLKIEQICLDLSMNTQCFNFVEKFKTEMIEVKSQIYEIKSLTEKRKKRNLAILGKILQKTGGYALKGLKLGGQGVLISGSAYALNSALSSTSNNDDNIVLEMVKNQKELLKNQNEMRNQQNLLSTQIQHFNEISKGFMLMKKYHKEMRDIIIIIIKNRAKNDFFGIVDYANFTEKIEKANKELGPKFSLPNVSAHDLIEISRIVTTKNSSTVSISIEIPIISTKREKFLN